MARTLRLLTVSLVFLFCVQACRSTGEDSDKSDLYVEVYFLVREATRDVGNQDFDAAMEKALRALEISRTSGGGYPLGEVWALYTITGIDIMSSRDADAWEKAVEAESLARRHGFTKELSQILIAKAKICSYAEISPGRLDKNGVSAFISIMRGCNNVCSYCVVPYTRGAERSREPQSILREAQEIYANGYKEVTLLGQNVDSYFWKDKENPANNVNFAQLLEMVAKVSPELRVRFSTSHPKDISDEVIYTMAMYENICKHIHLPVQSGSSIMLEKMRRKYNREWYLERVKKIRSVIPDCGITTDVIAGFCGETEVDHKDTLTLMEEVVFDSAFMFAYSERPGTLASRKYPDDIPYETKTKRLNEIIELQGRMSLKSNEKEVGRRLKVLVEGPSKRNPDELCGRAGNYKMCVFPSRGEKAGDYCEVEVTSVTPATLLCKRID